MENIYEVTAPLWVKLFIIIGFVALCITMTFDHEFSIVNLWHSKDWIGIIGLFFFFIVMPVLMLIVLFTKTVFTSTGIIHRNLIFRETLKRYEDISAVEVTKRADIRLHFVDGTSIKVLTGESYLLKTLQILEEHVIPDLLPQRRQ